MTVILLVVSLLGAGLAWRYGYRRRTPGGRGARLRAGFYAFLVLAFVLAVAVWQERAAPDVLAGRGITPYPGFDSAVWVPALPGASTRTWMFNTRDPFRTVLNYYRDRAHYPGWTLEEESTIHLYLRKGASCLQITFGRNLSILSRDRTTTFFTFHDPCPP
ncbi:MAG TPA: hypothetical protein VGR24_00570 [bacterium]|jgi:hypothetical protein|nr:hypothetical protein [bacterium]